MEWLFHVIVNQFFLAKWTFSDFFPPWLRPATYYLSADSAGTQLQEEEFQFNASRVKSLYPRLAPSGIHLPRLYSYLVILKPGGSTPDNTLDLAKAVLHHRAAVGASDSLEKMLWVDLRSSMWMSMRSTM